MLGSGKRGDSVRGVYLEAARGISHSEACGVHSKKWRSPPEIRNQNAATKNEAMTKVGVQEQGLQENEWTAGERDIASA
jgi:hypothetical protein